MAGRISPVTVQRPPDDAGLARAPRTVSAAYLVVPLGALLGACGGPTGEPDAGALDRDAAPDGSPVELDASEPSCVARTPSAVVDTFVEDFMRAYCTAIAGCNPGAVRWSTVEECVSSDVERMFNIGVRWGDALRAVVDGHLVLDETAAAACVDDARAVCERLDLDAADWFDPPPRPCSDMFDYRCPAGSGSACWDGSECPEGTFCLVDFGRRNCGLGTCEPLVRIGDPCRDEDVCAQPGTVGRVAICAWDDEGRTSKSCREVELGDPVPEGEACDILTYDPEPLVVVPCADGLSCENTTGLVGGPHVCTRGLEAG